VVEEPDLDQLLRAAGEELAATSRWGLTFTVVQTWATVG
jgi:hypothetical protein